MARHKKEIIKHGGSELRGNYLGNKRERDAQGTGLMKNNELLSQSSIDAHMSINWKISETVGIPAQECFLEPFNRLDSLLANALWNSF